ncbi:MAG: hypothetical protein AAF433_20605 [Bacteroidota bacterium]
MFIALLLAACQDDNAPELPEELDCILNLELTDIDFRNFGMGFSSWPYGPEPEQVQETYEFIGANGDLYAEQLDENIPWRSWINGEELPEAFLENLYFRRSNAPADLPLLLSVSLLNLEKTELMSDYDGQVPDYTSLADEQLADAYFTHLDFLIRFFEPVAVVIGTEANEFLAKRPEKWQGYTQLMDNVRARLRETFPSLPLAESVTLHRWAAPEVADPVTYQETVTDYLQEGDFAAICFHPFLRNWRSTTQFQLVFDFLHERTDLPIAIVETSHLGDDLIFESAGVTIESDECQQQRYLETLLINAQRQRYALVLWWAHRDYDALLEIFPPEFREIGGVWKDTGLLTEEGRPRMALEMWQYILERN